MAHDDHEADAAEFIVSRSQRKRDARAREALGEALAQLPPARRAGLPLPEDLQKALHDLDRFPERGAHKRQLKYVGRLMREMEDQHFDAIAQALAQQRQGERQATAAFHALERWRDRLLSEGPPAVEAWCSRYPQTDRARLEALLARAREADSRTPPDPAPRRQLFRELRGWMAGTAPGEAGRE